MKNEYYVYMHKDSSTLDIIYVGVGYRNRAWEFKYGRNKHYLNYIKKHGNPVVEILFEHLNIDRAYEIEIELILKYGRKGIDSGGVLLNKSTGGKTSAKGNKQYITEEWKKKIGDANRGKKKLNEDIIFNIKKSNSKKVNQKDLNGNIIKIWDSVVEIQKSLLFDKKIIYNFLQKRTKTKPYGYDWEYVNDRFDKRTQRPGKPVYQYTLDMVFINKWNRVSDAVRETNIKGIQRAASGRVKTAGGYIWKYD